MSFSEAFELGFEKVSSIGSVAEEAAVPLLRRGIVGTSRLLAHAPESEKFVQYSYKLPAQAKEWQKFLHYGVNPVMAVHSVKSDIKDIKKAKDFNPQDLTNIRLKPNEIDYLKRKARNKAIGKTVGDVVSWGLVPTQFRNMPLNLGFGIGTGIGLPAAGEYLASKTTKLKGTD